MSYRHPEAGILKPGAVALFSGAIAYLLLASALQISLWQPDAGKELEHYLAIGAGILVFVVVFIRIRRGTWTREQTGDLSELDMDD